MNPNWQKLLSQHGANFETGIVQHFGDHISELKATADGTVLCDLSQFGTLRVSGEEAQPFLQNLLSNDIREVNTTHAQLSSLNTAKGRLLATLFIWQDGSDYLLQLPSDLIEIMHKKLNMYVLRAKVKITNASDEVIALGIAGNHAKEILNALFENLPNTPYSCLTNQQDRIINISETRYQIITSPASAEALWSSIQTRATPVGSSCWDWLNILAGIPIILPKTQEQFVAQMVNFDLLGGVSFKKGCYPGQEIVARTHYLGKLKRRMYIAHIDTAEIPLAGDELFSRDMEEQASGMVVNVAPSPTGGYDMLAVVQKTSLETQTVCWKFLSGTPLKFLHLPYLLLD